MNKDDILAKSRAENQGSDEYEKQVLEKAGRLSAQVGMVVCCVIAAASVMVTGRVNNACTGGTSWGWQSSPPRWACCSRDCLPR